MLPPGHIAGGYLTALGLIQTFHPQLTPFEMSSLLGIGILAAFIPDLDFFYAFFRVKALTIQENKIDHHDYVTHAALPWLVTGLVVYLLADREFYKYAGLLLWLGAWSHLFLDSLEGRGIRWLWPLTNRKFSLITKKRLPGISEPNFFKFWTRFVFSYPKHLFFTFTVEVSLIFIALIIYFKS